MKSIKKMAFMFLILTWNVYGGTVIETNDYVFLGQSSFSNAIIGIDIGLSDKPFRYGYFKTNYLEDYPLSKKKAEHWDTSITNGGVVLVAGSNITVNGSTNMVPLTNGATVIISSVGGGGGAGSLSEVLFIGNDAAGQAATNFNYLHQTNQAVLFELKDNENIGLESTGYPVTRQKYGVWAGVGALCNNTNNGWPPGSFSEGNVALGYQALFDSEGGWNIAIGKEALMGSGSTFWYGAGGNIAIGEAALKDSNGRNNDCYGDYAGWGLVGKENIGIGDGALYGANQPNDNLRGFAFGIAMGMSALQYGGSDLQIGIGYEAFTGEEDWTYDPDIDDYIISTNYATGDFSIHIGSYSGSLADGQRSVHIGAYSFKDGSGDENTGVGYSAMDEYFGGRSVAIGAYALSTYYTNFENTAIGYQSMSANYGDRGGNSAVGAYSLMFVDGNYNSALGAGAASGGNGDYWGSSNVMIGAGSGSSHPYPMINNSISLGAGSPSLGHNSMVLGNEQITNTFIYGNISVTGSIIPVVSNSYDIGSPTKPFRHGYFDTNSLYLGNYKISKEKAEYWDKSTTNAIINNRLGTISNAIAVVNLTLEDITGTNSVEINGGTLQSDSISGKTETIPYATATLASGITNEWWDISASSNGLVVAALSRNSVDGLGYVYIGTNGPNSLEKNITIGQRPVCQIYVLPDGSKVYYSYYTTDFNNPNGSFVVTANNGSSWSTLYGPTIAGRFGVSDDGLVVIFEQPGYGFYRSTNGGSGWASYTPIVASASTVDCSVSGDGKVMAYVIHGVNYRNDIYVSTNSGASWLSEKTDDTYGLNDVALSYDGSRLYLSTSGQNYNGQGRLHSLNGPDYSVFVNLSPLDARLDYKKVDCSANGSGVILITERGDAGTNGTVYVSTNYGVTFSSPTNLVDAGGGVEQPHWLWGCAWVESLNGGYAVKGGSGDGKIYKVVVGSVVTNTLNLLGDVTVYGSLSVNGSISGSANNLSNFGHIIPASSNTYNIGSPSLPFSNGYIGTNSQSLLILVPQSISVPAVRGGIYFNSSDNKFYKCTNGVDWVDLLAP